MLPNQLGWAFTHINALLDQPLKVRVAHCDLLLHGVDPLPDCICVNFNLAGLHAKPLCIACDLSYPG
jgi:hypothetical protein